MEHATPLLHRGARRVRSIRLHDVGLAIIIICQIFMLYVLYQLLRTRRELPSLLTHIEKDWVPGACTLRVSLPASLPILASEWNVPESTLALAAAWVPCELGARYAADVGAVYLIAKGVSERVANAGFIIALDYARKYDNYADPDPVIHQSRHPYLDWFFFSTHQFATAFRHRLAHLLLGRDSAGIGSPRDVMRDFLAAQPEWSSANSSFILFRDHPKLVGKMVCRIQLSGVCSYHSALVGLSYLLQLAGTVNTTVDISHFVLARMNRDHVGAYLFGGQGVEPETVVEHAYQTALGSDYPVLLRMGDQPSEFALHEGRLLSSGPAVATFRKPGRRFGDPGVLSFTGPLELPHLPGHSMLVVGVHFDASSGLYFALMQNWWEGQELVAVREDYWRACGASAFFATTPQTALRSDLRTFGADYAYTTVENARVPVGRNAV